MSIRVMTAVWDCDGITDRGETLVLLALADFCDDGGRCYPSIPRIAEKARMSDRGVQLIIQALRERGVLHITPGGGRNHTNRYSIDLDWLQWETVKPLHPSPERVKSPTLKGEVESTEKVKPASPEPSLEPSLNREDARTREGEPGSLLSHPAVVAFSEAWPAAMPDAYALRRLVEWYEAPDHTDVRALVLPATFSDWRTRYGTKAPIVSDLIDRLNRNLADRTTPRQTGNRNGFEAPVSTRMPPDVPPPVPFVPRNRATA